MSDPPPRLTSSFILPTPPFSLEYCFHIRYFINYNYQVIFQYLAYKYESIKTENIYIHIQKIENYYLHF